MLKEQIIKDLTESMKARDELRTGVLRMLKADIMKFEVSGADKEATDEVVSPFLNTQSAGHGLLSPVTEYDHERA